MVSYLHDAAFFVSDQKDFHDINDMEVLHPEEVHRGMLERGGPDSLQKPRHLRLWALHQPAPNPTIRDSARSPPRLCVTTPHLRWTPVYSGIYLYWNSKWFGHGFHRNFLKAYVSLEPSSSRHCRKSELDSPSPQYFEKSTSVYLLLGLHIE